jgi:hypothetical protein
MQENKIDTRGANWLNVPPSQKQRRRENLQRLWEAVAFHGRNLLLLYAVIALPPMLKVILSRKPIDLIDVAALNWLRLDIQVSSDMIQGLFIAACLVLYPVLLLVSYGFAKPVYWAGDQVFDLGPRHWQAIQSLAYLLLALLLCIASATVFYAQ